MKKKQNSKNQTKFVRHEIEKRMFNSEGQQLVYLWKKSGSAATSSGKWMTLRWAESAVEE